MLPKSYEATTPAAKAQATGRWAEVLFKALSSRVAKRWQFISFRGAGKGEWRGVVDVLAIRKNTAQPTAAELKRGDLFELILVQIKGGGAKAPTAEDLIRLQAVAKHYDAKAIVLFNWKKEQQAEFFVLNRSAQWEPTSAVAIFG